MSSLGSQGEARERSAFISGESSNTIDTLPDMAAWFASEAAAEKALPRVVGKLPDFGAPKPTKKVKRLKLGKFLKNATFLTLTFFLGAASTYRLNDAPKLAQDDAEGVASPKEETVDLGIDDWPDLGSVTGDVAPIFDPGDFTASASSQTPSNGLYSNFDDLAFTEPAATSSPSASDAWGTFAPAAPPSELLASNPADASSQKVPSAYERQDVAFAADSRAGAPLTAQGQSAAGGFAGFQGYEFSESPVAQPYGLRNEETTTTAERERDRFLANAESAPRAGDFNNNADFNNFAKNSSQNIPSNGVNEVTPRQNFGYNDQNGYNENRVATTQTTAAPQDLPDASSRFAGFGSSWDAPSADDVAPAASFTESRSNDEFVAQRFDDPIIATPAPSQRPARTVRW